MKRSRSRTKKRDSASQPIHNLGERAVLKILLKGVESDPRNPSGVGDDAAVWRPPPGRDLLISVDTLVEGVDFEARFSPNSRFIGHKVLAANLSDIAAMGGCPRAFVVSLAAPGSTPLGRLTGIYSGIRSLARRAGVNLIGGDLSASPRHLLVTITIFGDVAKNRAISRKGAGPGDTLFVSGSLGDSRAGLEILTRGKKAGSPGPSTRNFLIKRHLFPSPRIELGKWLSENNWATAMIDLSDGFAADIRNLCDQSGVGARFEPGGLPVSKPLREYCRIRRKKPEAYAVGGGEDFELLFSIPQKRCAVFQSAALKKGFRVFPVGEIVPREKGIFRIGPGGRRVPLKIKGYEHFSD